MASKINAQQLPKIKEVLECFVARPGHKLVDSDFASLEPKVIATFSGDLAYRELYAAGKPHDVYLFVAAQLFPDQRDALDAVYNLAAPTKESVSEAKRLFKRERGIAKTVHLAAGYGASARKMYQTMRLGGEDVTLEDVVAMRQRYWQTFAGVKGWERDLQLEREHRGGWIYNGHGRPLSVPEHRVKDLGNVFAQSTGHDCLLTFVWYLDKFRKERGVEMYPWIPDFHDETLWEVPDAHVAAAVQCFKDAYHHLNLDLGGGQPPEIPITGEIDVVDNLAQAKGLA